MAKINKGRVILGGLLAGLVLNIGEYLLNEPLLGQQWKEAMSALNLAQPGGGAICVMLALMFLVGIFIIWLYAAIRPRGRASLIQSSFIPFSILWRTRGRLDGRPLLLNEKLLLFFSLSGGSKSIFLKCILFGIRQNQKNNYKPIFLTSTDSGQ